MPTAAAWRSWRDERGRNVSWGRAAGVVDCGAGTDLPDHSARVARERTRLTTTPESEDRADTAHLSRVRRALRHLRAILRWEGAAGLICRALERLGWGRAGIYVGDLDEVGGAHEGAIPPTVEVFQLRADDASAYQAFRAEPAAAATLAERLRERHRCFAARRNGEIVAAIWVAVGPARVRHVRREFRPAPTEIYLFDALTVARCRGKHLQVALVTAIAATYRARGYRTAVMVIAPHNRSSRQCFERTGFRRRAAVYSLRRGPIRTADACDGAGPARLPSAPDGHPAAGKR